MAKASLRLTRIRRVARLSARLSRKLCSTGYRPQAAYHVPVVGATPSLVRKLRAAVAVSSGLGGPGRCTTTAIALSVGSSCDPVVTSVATL
eukprot:12949835-Alexandrium_andersonii.AAC.1